jgi:hypothetical protein
MTDYTGGAQAPICSTSPAMDEGEAAGAGVGAAGISVTRQDSCGERRGPNNPQSPAPVGTASSPRFRGFINLSSVPLITVAVNRTHVGARAGP